MTLPPSAEPSPWELQRNIKDLRVGLGHVVDKEVYLSEKRALEATLAQQGAVIADQHRQLGEQRTHFDAEIQRLEDLRAADIEAARLQRQADQDAARRQAQAQEEQRRSDRRLLIYSGVIPFLLVLITFYLQAKGAK